MLGDDVDEPADRLAAVKRGGWTFHYFQAFDHGLRYSHQPVYRGQAAHDRHSVDQHHGVGPFQSVQVNIPGIAYAAVELGAQAVDGLQRFEQIGSGIGP